MTWSHLYAALLGTLVIVQALGLWAAVGIVMRGRTAQGATAWALGLVLLPVLSLPLYLVFGERKFYGYVRARRQGNRGIDRVAAELFENIKPYTPAAPPPDAAALQRLARAPFTTGNDVELLIDGAATFDAVISAVNAARRYILIQFYIFREDGLGKRVQKALLDARARGVSVHLLYDEIGSYSLPQSYLDALTQAGCKCSGFRTKPRKQRRFRINFRNHRKIVVVDGEVAFIGGHNVGDEYLGLNPRMSPWRDTHVEIRGPAVMAAQLSFLEDWYWANRNIPDLNWTPSPAEGGTSTVLVVPTGPADDLETCLLFLTQLANSARRRLWIATPYFVPDELALGALQLASLRGVDVRVIIPERNDSRLVWLSAFSYYDEVLPAGVKLFRYQPGFMHQKVVLSDDTACISTANFDNRSFRINFEVSALVADTTFAEEVGAMLETDFTRCREVKKGEFEKMPYWFRLASRVSRLLAPVQ